MAGVLEALASEGGRPSRRVGRRAGRGGSRSSREPGLVLGLTKLLVGLLPRARPEVAERFSTVLFEVDDPRALKVLAAASAAGGAGYLGNRAVVDLLKYPLCQGPARAALLGLLEKRKKPGDRRFRSVWDVAEHAEALGLQPADLDAPPLNGGNAMTPIQAGSFSRR